METMAKAFTTLDKREQKRLVRLLDKLNRVLDNIEKCNVIATMLNDVVGSVYGDICQINNEDVQHIAQIISEYSGRAIEKLEVINRQIKPP